MHTDNQIHTRVICDGYELANAQVFMVDQPVPWLHEISYASDMHRRRVGHMHVDYQGWHAFLDRENWGTHQPVVFEIRTPHASSTMLQVWAKNLPPNGRFPTESLVLAPFSRTTHYRENERLDMNMTDEAKQYMVSVLATARSVLANNTLEALDLVVPDTVQDELQRLGFLKQRGMMGSPWCLTSRGVQYVKALAASR